MEVALDLWVRQIGLLALLAALGSGPAALLPGSVPAAARLALAPALGLAIGAAAGVSVAYLMPMTTGAWALMLPLTLASCGFATWRSRRARDWSWRPPGLQLALLAGLAVVVSGAANAPLLAEESLGPLGYTITDANYLVIQHDALEDASLRELEVPPPSAESEVAAGAVPTAPAPGTSPEDLDLLVDTVNTIPVGFASLAATTDVLFAWHAVDTQTPFLGVLLVVVALGGFAAVCMLSQSALAGAVTGLLLAGPVTYQLYVESGEGALSSIAFAARDRDGRRSAAAWPHAGARRPVRSRLRGAERRLRARRPGGESRCRACRRRRRHHPPPRGRARPRGPDRRREGAWRGRNSRRRPVAVRVRPQRQLRVLHRLHRRHRRPARDRASAL